MVTITNNDSVIVNNSTSSGNPVFRIAGDRVRLVDSEFGRVVESVAGQPAVVID